MKKIITIALMFITVITTSAFAEKATWKKQENFHYPLYMERYTTQIGNIYCAVNINIDGELVIYATDANYDGKTASQYLRIKEGEVISNKTSIIEYKEMTRSEVNGDYNVFEVSVVPYTSSLPKHIREKFKGAFNVK